MVSSRWATEASTTVLRDAPPGPPRSSSSSGIRLRLSATLLVVLGQPDEHLAGDLAIVRVERGEHSFRGGGDRPGDSTRREVAREGEGVVVASGPGADHRHGHQREPPVAAQHVADDGVDELGFDGEARGGSRPLQHLAELGLGEGRHQLEAAHHASGHAPVLRQQADVVRADHQDAAPDVTLGHEPEQAVEERRALARVGLGRPLLLQLVDDQKDGNGRRLLAGELRKGVDGVRSRRDDHLWPFLAAGQGARGQRGEQTGAHDRGLSRSAGTRHDQERAVDQQGDQPLDQVRPAAEQRCVLGLVGGEALVGAAGDAVDEVQRGEPVRGFGSG